MLIKTPQKYISEGDAIKKSGEYVAEYSKNPLIIGGKTALSVALEKLKNSFIANGITSDNVEIFEGYPSENQFEKYSNLAKKIGADSIVALGGGRVIDTAKAAAELADIPVITVPTIA